jgi:hypothetical protein
VLYDNSGRRIKESQPDSGIIFENIKEEDSSIEPMSGIRIPVSK